MNSEIAIHYGQKTLFFSIYIVWYILILQYYQNGLGDFTQTSQINKIKSNESSPCNMLLEIFIMWGCVDLKDCFSAGDLSNIASTYIGIIIGALIGGFISWLIYNRQEKTAVIQKEIQDHILNLEEKHEISLKKHENILEKIQIVEQNHDEMLNKILTLDKKINSLLESK
jgi:hypothetical protein